MCTLRFENHLYGGRSKQHCSKVRQQLTSLVMLLMFGLCSKYFMKNIEKMKQLSEPLASAGKGITLIVVVNMRTTHLVGCPLPVLLFLIIGRHKSLTRKYIESFVL